MSLLITSSSPDREQPVMVFERLLQQLYQRFPSSLLRISGLVTEV